MLLMMLAGWINKEQQHMIEYLRDMNICTGRYIATVGLILQVFDYDSGLKERL